MFKKKDSGAAAKIVHIKLPEDGYEKTISSLRQLMDELMHQLAQFDRRISTWSSNAFEKAKNSSTATVLETDRKIKSRQKKVRCRSNVRMVRFSVVQRKEKWRSTENTFGAEMRARCKYDDATRRDKGCS